MIKRIVIVGLGSIGRRYIKIISENWKDLELCFIRSGKSKPDNHNLAVKGDSYDCLQEAIKSGIQAAILCSPSSLHIQQAIEFVKAKIPVLIEKPLSCNLDSTNYLKELSKNLSVPVLVGYCFSHCDSLNKLISLYSNNHAGESFYVRIECSSYLPNWRPAQDFKNTVSANSSLGGGVLLELSHELEYAIRIFGPFSKLFAKINKINSLGLDVEESAEIILTNKNHLRVSIHLSFCSRAIERTCRIYGNKSVLKWDGINDRTSIHKDGKELDFWQFSKQRNDMFIKQLKHFFECVSLNIKPVINLENGIYIARIHYLNGIKNIRFIKN